MIRIIVRSENYGRAANVGGSVDVEYKTFDVDLPEVEAYLREQHTWEAPKQVVGVEVLAPPPKSGGAP